MPDNLPTHRLAPSAGAHGDGRCGACGSKAWTKSGDCSNSACAVRCCSECGGIVRDRLLCLDCLAEAMLEAVMEVLTEQDVIDINIYSDAGCTPAEIVIAIAADRRAN